MYDVIKSIDWNQIGPFTALLVVVLLIMLGIAPFAFRYFGKRSDLSSQERKQQLEMEAADRKRRDEREDRKDQALLHFVKTTEGAVDKMTEGLGKLQTTVIESKTEVIKHVTAEVKAIHNGIGKLRDDLDDKKQDQILHAVRSSYPSSPT